MSCCKIFAIFTALLLVCNAQKSLPSCRRYMCIIKTIRNLTSPYIFTPEYVDPTLCTHLLLFNMPLDGNKLKSPYWNDDTGPNGIYHQLKKMKEERKNLKLLLSVGDRGANSKGYSLMTATEAGRREFIEFIIPFLRKRGFDGVDINWYIPTLFGGAPDDKKRFAALITEMSGAFDKEAENSNNKRLILSAWGIAYASLIDDGYDVPIFASHVDFINIITFNYNGYKGKPIGHLSPLLSGDFYNIKDTIRFWVDRGMPKNKINMALPAYGMRVKTKTSDDMILGQSMAIEGAPPGKYINVTGFLSQYEVCELLKHGGQVYWDTLAHSPYHKKDNYFLTFENEQSYKDKIRFARESGLGGVVIRDMDEDDYLGLECGKGKFPMMRTAKELCTVRMY